MKSIYELITAAVVLFATASLAFSSDSITEVTYRLKSDPPSWLPAGTICPADVIRRKQVKVRYLGERCVQSPTACLNLCEASDANACYTLALAIETVDNRAGSESLFLRACELGVVSGCTNRAAGMMRENFEKRLENFEETFECPMRTFEKSCELHDPWGCTMKGLLLSRPKYAGKDIARAKKALFASCRIDAENEACKYAQAILRNIEGSE